jgi:hypothetical protein
MKCAPLVAVLALVACKARETPSTSDADTTINSTSAPVAATPASTSIDRGILKGGWWTPDGQSFTLSVEDTTILYEFDMKNHPYQLRGDTIIVDFQDPTLGVQKKLVLKLTRDTLVIQDVQYQVSETLVRVRNE